LSQATGIHTSGTKLRLVALEGGADGITPLFLAETDLGEAICPQALRSPESRLRISGALRHAFANGPGPVGECVLGLAGGLYQVQRVPLELASDEDRREQVLWEASQALISPPEEYVLEVYAAGRAAFWVAYRSCVVETLRALFRDSGVDIDAVAAEPVAMARAGTMAQEPGSGMAGVVHWEFPWLTFVSVQDGQMVAAETSRAHTSCRGSGTLPDDLVEAAQRWVSSDLASGRNRAPCGRVLYCGGPEGLRRIADQLRGPLAPEVAQLDVFSRCDTAFLGAESAPEHSAGEFGIAAGLAHMGLSERHGEASQETTLEPRGPEDSA